MSGRSRFALCALLLGYAAIAVSAESYPARPIRFVVPYPPGGGTDIVTRLISPPLAEGLGQQIVIDNRGGAGGIIGTEIVAKALPDGYTMLFVVPAQTSVNPALYKSLPYDPLRDFAPVTQLTIYELAMVAHPSLPASSVKQLLALAKAKPGTINLGSAGSGSAGHMAAEWFRMMTGVQWVHVPYKGAGPALTELIGGQVQVLFATTLATLPHVRAGRLKPLGVTGTKRSPAAPDVPTIAESVPGYEFTQWQGVVVPAKTPRAIIKRLNAELVKVMNLPRVKERVLELGSIPVGSTPEQFAVLLKSELEKYAKIVKAAGIKVD